MTSYCLTYIEDSMTIYYIIHNGNPLKFYMEPYTFKEYFKDRKSFYMITKYSDMQLIEAIDGLFENMLGDIEYAEQKEVYYDPLVRQFIESTFKDPDTFLEEYPLPDSGTKHDEIYLSNSGTKHDDIYLSDSDDETNVPTILHSRTVVSDCDSD